ncbi:emp24/gp25L/p24 family/GOLD-domain-containing protein [Gorgonomyces haynaldii]|nr:emp24/gp25L/p24 family/GOLD-domain-containing protein [Gorgonomyces haynaldii]
MLILPFVQATTLTFKLGAHERGCYYANTKEIGEKVAFYFAVQSGGNFDVDYDVMDPHNTVLLHGNAEQQGDFAFTAQKVGEYSFCFSNSMSTFAQKVIDFDITVEHESKFANGRVISDLEKAIGKLAGQAQESAAEKATVAFANQITFFGGELAALERRQRSIRTREHRNLASVKSLESRIYWISSINGVLMVLMSVGQVFVIQNFFSRGRSRI